MAPLYAYTQSTSPGRAAHDNSGIYSLRRLLPKVFFNECVETTKEYTGDEKRSSRDWKWTIQFCKYFLIIYHEPETIPLFHVVTSVVTL